MAFGGQKSPPSRRKILLVYEENSARAAIVRALGAAYEVVSTSDAKCAPRLLSSRARQVEMVLVTCLARKAGPRYLASVDLVQTLFERWPWIPVVIISRPQETPRLTADTLATGVRKLLGRPDGGPAFHGAIKHLLSRPGACSRATPDAVATIRRILAFLGAPLGVNPTLGGLANLAGMSRSHFSRTFHAVAGMPLRDYVRDLRLMYAHELVLASELSLTTVAIEAGFYDLPHLDKAFRQRIGMSPEGYRRRYGSPVERAR